MEIQKEIALNRTTEPLQSDDSKSNVAKPSKGAPTVMRLSNGTADAKLQNNTKKAKKMAMIYHLSL